MHPGSLINCFEGNHPTTTDAFPTAITTIPDEMDDMNGAQRIQAMALVAISKEQRFRIQADPTDPTRGKSPGHRQRPWF
jgi:hypothetical protein